MTKIVTKKGTEVPFVKVKQILEAVCYTNT